MSTPLADRHLYLQAVGTAGPGMPDWPTAAAILRGEQAYEPTVLPPYRPNLLPPNERRRASRAVCAAFQVAEQAVQGCDASQLATVFSSADGDEYITERICRALDTPERMLSPTDFHHSVHNAPAGNWSIAAGAQGPATALAAWHWGFAAALAEAACMVLVEQRDTLLITYDLQAPEFLRPLSLAQQPFAVALRLSGSAGASPLARFTITMHAAPETRCSPGPLEALRLCNPAARCLPLLQAIATQAPGEIQLACGADPVRSGLRVGLAIP
jgi:hypothetical protein